MNETVEALRELRRQRKVAREQGLPTDDTDAQIEQIHAARRKPPRSVRTVRGGATGLVQQKRRR
jgi:hypothetical protein